MSEQAAGEELPLDRLRRIQTTFKIHADGKVTLDGADFVFLLALVLDALEGVPSEKESAPESAFRCPSCGGTDAREVYSGRRRGNYCVGCSETQWEVPS